MLEESYKLLKEQDIRITPQRKAILEILYDHRGEHLEIEDIHRMLAAGGGGTSRMGLATVYRAIELFQRVGLVYRLPMDNSPGRYEFIGPRTPGHHHLICLECGAATAATVKPAHIDMDFAPCYNGICPLRIWHMPDTLSV